MPLATQQSGQLPRTQSGQLPATFSPGVPQAPSLQAATVGILMSQAPQSATSNAQLSHLSQMSPTTSGQLALSAAAEQQCEMLLRQAQQSMQQQNPAAAFNYVEQALLVAPHNTSALILKAQLLSTAGRFQEALNVIEQVLKIDPDNALGWSMRAALLSNMGRFQMALRAVEHSLELDPNNPETYSVKTSIMGQVAAYQSQGNSKKLVVPQPKKPEGSFVLDMGLQVLGLLVEL